VAGFPDTTATPSHDAPDRAAWFAELGACFAAAVRHTGRVEERSFRVGGLLLRLRFAGEATQRIVCPAFEHLASQEPDATPDYTFHLFSQRDSPLLLPPPPAPLESFSPRGDIQGFNTEWLKASFQPFGKILSACHLPERRAVICYGEPDFIYNFERAAPLRPLLAWIMRARGRQLVHAGAVACQGEGILLGGKGGSGKSNTALACLLAGLDFLSDDFCAVASLPLPTAYSLFATARTRRTDFARLPDLARLADRSDPLPQDKELYFLAPAFPRQTIASCRIKAIFLPQVSTSRSIGLEPVSSREALLSLAPVTTTLLPDAGPEVLANLGALARSLPAYRLHLGNKNHAIPAFIRDFLASP
jgi:hypothetical protein